MKKTPDQCRGIIQKPYKKLKYVWLLDREDYAIPPLKEFREMITERLESPVCKKLWKLMKESDDYDCDDFTIQLRAMIKARRPRWCVPECLGVLDEGLVTTVHSRFLGIVEEGLKIIEPEDGSIHEPDQGSYNIFAVWG